MVSYQKSTDNLSLQLSAFSRYGQIDFSPDPIGDLVFQGVSGRAQQLCHQWHAIRQLADPQRSTYRARD